MSPAVLIGPFGRNQPYNVIPLNRDEISVVMPLDSFQFAIDKYFKYESIADNMLAGLSFRYELSAVNVPHHQSNSIVADHIWKASVN
jgi:hypothetical protein